MFQFSDALVKLNISGTSGLKYWDRRALLGFRFTWIPWASSRVTTNGAGRTLYKLNLIYCGEQTSCLFGVRIEWHALTSTKPVPKAFSMTASHTPVSISSTVWCIKFFWNPILDRRLTVLSNCCTFQLVRIKITSWKCPISNQNDKFSFKDRHFTLNLVYNKDFFNNYRRHNKEENVSKYFWNEVVKYSW